MSAINVLTIRTDRFPISMNEKASFTLPLHRPDSLL